MNLLETPNKKTGLSGQETAQASHQKLQGDIVQIIDFKERNFQLMNKITELQIKNVKNQMYITNLFEKVQKYQKEISEFLQQNNAGSLSEAKINIQSFESKKWKNKIKEYVSINNKQQPFELREKRLNQQISQKEEFLERYRHKISQYNTKINISNSSQEKISNENKTLKTQYKNAILQNTNLRDQIDQLKQQLKLKQITIKQMKQSPTYKQQKQEVDSQFSFADKKQISHISQPEGQQKIQDLKVQIQCYKASIDGLLQQNKRLKKSFQALCKQKKGEQLSPQLQKEISIMMSILDLKNFNSRQTNQ